MPLCALIAALLLAAPAPVAAKTPRTTSAYTKIDLGRCKIVEQDGGTYSNYQCEGYAGVPLFVEGSDIRSDISAGSAGGEFCGLTGGCGSTDAGKVVEWRVFNGKPFAIIYRLEQEYEEVKHSRLVVETIGTAHDPGCRIAEVPGWKTDAKALARAAADQVLTGKTKCLSAH